MKAARFHEYGGPVLVEDVPVPPVGPGEVLVRVAATSHNPVDVGIRAGALKAALDLALPHTPGADIAGIVEQLGVDVEGVNVGDAVVGFIPLNLPGAAAEQVVVPAAILAAAPTTIDLADAACLPLVSLTAQQALFEHGRLEAGQRVLVNGGGSAVGAYAVQLAVLAGAEVLATAGPASTERVASYGPKQVIDHTTTALRDAFEGQVDLVVNVAPTPFDELAALVRPGGRVVSASTEVTETTATGVTGIRMRVRSDAAQLADLVEKVDAGELSVWIGERRSLDEIAEVQAGNRSGKTVLLTR